MLQDANCTQLPIVPTNTARHNIVVSAAHYIYVRGGVAMIQRDDGSQRKSIINIYRYENLNPFSR